MPAVVSWTCPSCHSAVSTPYCPRCGERPRNPRDLTLRGLIDQAFAAFTSIDGRVLRSLRHLITRPGLLTVAFLEGRRKPYIGPVSLFVIANVLFFAAEALTGGTIFSTPLESHLHRQPWSGTAQGLVANRLAALNTTTTLYGPRFDSAIAIHARSLILLMTLSFAFLPAIVFRRPRQPFAAHAVFSLHLYAFMLLLFCIGTMVPVTLDLVVSGGLVVTCGVYLYFAIGTVYGGSPAARAFKSAGLAIGVAAIVLGYRFVLLLITLYTA
jgi:hypothetical protein